MSYASRLVRATVLTPAAEPAGRAFAKSPPAKTRLPAIPCCQTTPFTWTVGSESAATVAGVPAAGRVSACAGAATTRPTNVSAAAVSPARTRATGRGAVRAAGRGTRADDGNMGTSGGRSGGGRGGPRGPIVNGH